MEETYILAMRCPVYRRRESIPGFRTELENLAGDEMNNLVNWQQEEPTGYGGGRQLSMDGTSRELRGSSTGSVRGSGMHVFITEP